MNQQLEPKFYNSPLAQAIRDYAASGRKDSVEIKVDQSDPWWGSLPDGHFSDDGELYVTVWRGRKGGLVADILDHDDIALICAPAGQ